jgi:hypothetical protein
LRSLAAQRLSLPALMQLGGQVAKALAAPIARRQSAKSLELRAVTSLSHLYQKQGKNAEARLMLAEIYGWFREGWDTADLQEAKAFLPALS